MTIVAKTLSEQVYSLVRDRILSNELPANLPIRQDALAKELGVSKIPLREAFARLERDGLLQSVTNRGFFVYPLSAKEAEEVYALRLKMEPEAVGRAAKKATAEDKAIARTALNLLDKAAANDRVAVGRLNREFHMTLVRPIRQLITVSIIERLNLIAERYVHKHLEPAGRRKRAKKEHTEMFEAWCAGQSKVVESMMYDHIASTLEDLRNQIEIQNS
ncbi:DNA-binding GntR family transcriptional regulator [Rhizomicrobium palustre]|uniref:DNA-binding GntR family transcriptional regulator n=1 Tax=Rhizomicrobium palustre TaxID=189966 RepID=A0A846N2P0_9PROT|nr:GntR family transcriptional regulator [Rhizomicrobium palustre]NIK89492.1 DNA-binding GntR family transcriptional regulator [Rhizomicrobium palustre]